MRPFPRPHTLGRTAIALGCILGGLPAAPTAALAQMQTYYHVGTWDAFSGRNDKGSAECGIGNTNSTDNRRVTIRFDIGGTDTVATASKPDWSIPDGTRVTVVMQVGLNTPWTEQGIGHEHGIEWTIDRTAIQAFYQQFRNSTSMTLTFPDGNEPPWTVSLAGSSAITDALDRCVRDLTRQVEAGQAPGGGGAPAAPTGPTQPFSAPAGAPPAEAPASGTQPPATQPTQPTR
jgi:hypothetical protein